MENNFKCSNHLAMLHTTLALLIQANCILIQQTKPTYINEYYIVPAPLPLSLNIDIEWLAYFPDLNMLYFFLSGYLKSTECKLNRIKLQDSDDLRRGIRSVTLKMLYIVRRQILRILFFYIIQNLIFLPVISQ